MKKEEFPTKPTSPSKVWEQEGKEMQSLLTSATQVKKQFGRYQIVEELGRGGMGCVYKAYDKELNRHIALKVIVSGASAGQREIDRFLQEAKATAKLKHPNIVTVYDIGIEGNSPYFTMDLIEGISLKEYLQKPSRDIRKIVKMMMEIAETLHYAHKQEIIHRDIKPANIMISKENVPLVMDFGLAKVNSDQQLSKTGDVIGTPAYMSPEQAQGKQIDKTTDVYALGATLYEVITSRPPFQGETYFFIVKQILEDEPVAPRILNPEIAIELEAICLKALEKNRNKRYKSAGVLARDLSNFLKNKPIIARPPTKFTKLKKWLRQNTAITFFILLLLGIVFWALAKEQKAILAEKKVKEEKEKMLIQLAQVALDRASTESSFNWNKAGAYAGKSLTFANKIKLSQNLTIAEKLKTESQKYIHWALVNSGLLFKAHTKGYGRGVAWSPNGKLFASCAWDKTVRIWDFATGKQIKKFVVNHKNINCLAYSPDNKTIAFGDRNILRIYSVAKGKEIKKFKHKHHVSTIAYSPDGEFLAVANGTIFNLWNVVTGEVKEVHGHALKILSIAYAPSGKFVATGSRDRTIGLWEIATGKMHKLKIHTKGVTSVVFSPDSKKLMSASLDKKIIIWSIKKKKAIKKFNNLFSIRAIAYNPDGKTFACGSKDQIEIWDIDNGNVIKKFVNHYLPNSLAYSPDGKVLASTASDKTVRLWDTSNKILHRFAAPKNPTIHAPRPILFSADGKKLVKSFKEKIILVDINTRKTRRTKSMLEP